MNTHRRAGAEEVRPAKAPNAAAVTQWPAQITVAAGTGPDLWLYDAAAIHDEAIVVSNASPWNVRITDQAVKQLEVGSFCWIVRDGDGNLALVAYEQIDSVDCEP